VKLYLVKKERTRENYKTGRKEEKLRSKGERKKEA
jgi:hypothetical protein